MSYVKFYEGSENVEDELHRFFFTTRNILRDELCHFDKLGILKASNTNLSPTPENFKNYLCRFFDDSKNFERGVTPFWTTQEF